MEIKSSKYPAAETSRQTGILTKRTLTPTRGAGGTLGRLRKQDVREKSVAVHDALAISL